jgi:small-conductance mechanosensitive channel
MLNELIQHLINYQYKSPLITQIAILAAILFVAWLLQFMLRRIARALKPHLPAAFWKESAIRIARSVTFWLTTLLLLNLIIIAFRNFWQKLPLVEAVNRFAVVWLIYRFVATLLEVTLEKEKARFWNRKVLFPLAIILGLLNVFDLVEVILNWGFQIGSIHWEITVGAVLLALGIVAGFVLLSRVLGKFLIRVLPDAGLETPMANTVSKIVAYTVITFGVLIALGTIGIDLTTLTVVAGGLSVGVAFGL